MKKKTKKKKLQTVSNHPSYFLHPHAPWEQRSKLQLQQQKPHERKLNITKVKGAPCNIYNCKNVKNRHE